MHIQALFYLLDIQHPKKEFCSIFSQLIKIGSWNLLVLQSIPVWINWLKYLSINNYSYRLLIKVQYSRNAQYGCGSSTGCQSIATSSAFRGISLGGAGVEVGALFLMMVVFRFLAYIALRSMKSRK